MGLVKNTSDAGKSRTASVVARPYAGKDFTRRGRSIFLSCR
jgi:hypothetical protein